MARVFISYRHVEPDASLARALHTRLSDADHDVFIDAADIPLGALWDTQIGRNVDSAEYFVPLVSVSYLHSRYILDRELIPAARRLRNGTLSGFLQINVAYDGEPPEALRDVLSAVQFVKWRSADDTTRVIDEVARALPEARTLVKGMRSYEAGDAERFAGMGREREIDQVLALLRTGSPMLLHGVSGAGKSSLIRAGLIPRLGAQAAAVVELTQDTREELTSAAPSAAVLFLDQFEQTLVRLAREQKAAATFSNDLAAWLDASRTTVVFCIRDEYRTAFDAMLPVVAKRCRTFPVLPFAPETGAAVLRQLLENARIEFNESFVLELCQRLAEGVPRTILPALLQLITQYCRNRGEPLTPGTWDRLSAHGAIFEDHVRSTVLDALPRRIRRLRACDALDALTAGDVKAAAKTIDEVAADSKVDDDTVKATLSMAALPHARVVRTDDDAGSTRYRLLHDLFVPSIKALRRDARQRHEHVRNAAVITTLAVLLFVIGGFWLRSYRQGTELQRRESLATAGRLAATAQAGQNVESSGLARGVALAVEALGRFDALGESSPEAVATIRLGMSLLPPRVGMLSLKNAAVLGFCRQAGHVVVRDESAVWEWDARRGQSPVKVTDLPAGARVALSHDNTSLAIAWPAEDGNVGVRVVGVESRSETLALTLSAGEHSPSIPYGIEFSPDDTRFAVAAGYARVIDVAAKREIHRLAPLVSNDLMEVFFPGSGEVLIGLNEDSDNTIWDLRNPSPRPLSRGENVLHTEQHVFVPGGQAGRVMAIPTAEARPILPVLNDDSFDVVEFHPTARLLAVRDGRSVSVYDMSGQRLATMVHTSNINAAAFNRRGTKLLTASRDGTARIWDARSGREITRVVDGPYDDALMSPDERTLIAVDSDGLTAWETTPRASHLRVSNIAWGGALAFSPDGRLLGRAEDKAVIATRTDDGHPVWTLPHTQRVSRVAFSPDGRYVATGETLGMVRLWDLQDRHEVWSAKAKDSAEVLTFSHDSRYLAAAAYFQAVVWEIPSGREVLQRTRKDRVRFVGFLPGDTEIIMAGDSNPIEVVRLADAVVLRETQPPRPVFNGALSADGRLAISSVTEAQVLDTSTWASLGSLTTPDQIERMAFTADGAHLGLAIGDDSSPVPTFAAQIVRVSSMERVQSISFQLPVTAVAFGARDRYFAVSSGDPIPREAARDDDTAGTTIWMWRPDDVRAAACGRLTRNLSLAAWRTVLPDEPCRAICSNLPACS